MSGFVVPLAWAIRAGRAAADALWAESGPDVPISEDRRDVLFEKWWRTWKDYKLDAREYARARNVFNGYFDRRLGEHRSGTA